jgi:predicted deacylase
MRKEKKMISYEINGSEPVVFPYYFIEGEENGPTICFTAGIHGCEYSSIIALIKLYEELDPQKIRGKVKIIPIVNLPAFKNITMFVCPVDHKNLNGLFPGLNEGSYSEKLVYKLFYDFIRGSDYYLDLHGGDLTEKVIPFVYVHQSSNKEVNEKSKGLAENYGTENIVFTNTVGHYYSDKGFTFSYVSESGIPAIQVEKGGIGQVEENDISHHISGILNVLKFIGCLKGNPCKKDKIIDYYNQYAYVRSKHEGIFFSQCKLGDQINEGDQLGLIKDYLGNDLEVVTSSYYGKIAMYNTSPAIKAGGVLFGVLFEHLF